MQWREDVGPARAGDAAARERLREYFTPFAHAVALAHAPHHVAERVVPRALDQALASLTGVADDALGPHVMAVARKLAKEASPGTIDEAGTTQPGLLEARQAVSRLRSLAEPARERLFLRLVEGVPGPEIAQVLRVPEGELRGELERAATDAARHLGQAQGFAGDGYLWELAGTPNALLARLEMQLPALRFDPTAAPAEESSVAGTFQELPAVKPGGLGGPMKPLLFEEFEGTETGVATTPRTAETKARQPAAAVRASAPVVPPVSAPGPNPFETQLPTMAATDLPAEARGTIPAPEAPPPSSRSGKSPALPARPVPASSETERSSKSNSGKNRSTRPEASKDSVKRIEPEPTREGPKLGDDDDATQARVPAAILAQQQADVVTSPEGTGVLGMPTMQMPLGAAVLNRAAVAQQLDTRLAVPAAKPPTFADSTALQGTHPLFLAGILLAVGLAIYSVSLFVVARQSRASWQLAQVVVAAEDMTIGDTITLENVALRAVPETFQGRGVVKAESMDFILEQKLAVSVQMGDPIFFSQLAALRKADQRLSTKVQKRTRAFTVEANAVQAVGRWVKPGDIVDIIVTFPPPNPERQKKKVERRAVTLLQKVTVLATGKIADALTEATLEEREKNWGDVTMLLTPEEAEQLTLAAQLGRVKLTLRNEEDLEEDRGLDDAFSDSDTLLDGARHRFVANKRQKIIQVIRGFPPAEEDPKRPGLKKPR